MKYPTTLTSLLILLLLPLSYTSAQTIIDKPIEFRRSVSNIFSPKSRTLEVTLERIYNEGEQDTTTHVKFYAERSDIEQTSISSSLNFIGSFVGSAAGNSYGIRHEDGLEYLSLSEVEDLVSCLRTVDIQTSKYKKEARDYERIVTCQSRSITVSHIFSPGKAIKYVITVGSGDSTYEIASSDFIDFRLALFKSVKVFSPEN